ncbi:MAG: hypothetical protein NT001_00935, partial [Candidatus Woesearchaeota archaeon]|nr:hypothetical protein [Candidatus Woesearchaeota archaeon]
KKALDVIDKSGIIDVFIHTNAVNLSEDVQKRMIQSKINTVCFSLGEFNDETRENVREKIKSNIISFRRMRDSMKKRTPIIRISLLPSENNMKEVKEYREFWKDYAD